MIVQNQSWMTRAECLGATHLFFPEEETEETVAAAKKICAKCPCVPMCCDFSLYEEFGVWAGMAPWERKKYRYKLSRSYLKMRPLIEEAVEDLLKAAVL